MSVPGDAEPGDARILERPTCQDSESGDDDDSPLMRADPTTPFWEPDFDESRLPHLPLIGWAFYPQAVKDFAERLNQDGRTVKCSWCLGPAMNVVIHMPFLYIALVFVVVGSSMSMWTSTCSDRNSIADSVWAWALWIPLLVLLLSAENYVLRYISVPFYQKTEGKWPNVLLQVADTIMPKTWWTPKKSSYAFATWHVWHTFTSALRLLSFFTTNMLIGSVLGDLFRSTCDGDDVDRIWHTVVHESIVPRMASELVSLRTVFIFLLVVQVLHLLVGVIFAYPGPRQWSDQGKMPLEKCKGDRDTYHQEFERDIIEYISHRANDPRRPNGTRFAYLPLCNTEELTSSQALHSVGVACGMTGIETIQMADMSLDEVDKLIGLIDEAGLSCDTLDRAQTATMSDIRKLLQKSRVATRSLFLYVFLYGFLFSTLSLNLQITYFNIRNMEQRHGIKPGRAPNLMIGVCSSFCSTLMIIRRVGMLLRWRTRLDRALDKYDAVYESNRREWQVRESHSLSEHLHPQIQKIRSGRRFYGVMIGLSTCFLVLGFAGGALKWVMTSFVCRGAIWNNLPPGCVEL